MEKWCNVIEIVSSYRKICTILVIAVSDEIRNMNVEWWETFKSNEKKPHILYQILILTLFSKAYFKKKESIDIIGKEEVNEQI